MAQHNEQQAEGSNEFRELLCEPITQVRGVL
jgi:hypothetical protein